MKLVFKPVNMEQYTTTNIYFNSGDQSCYDYGQFSYDLFCFTTKAVLLACIPILYPKHFMFEEKELYNGRSLYF